MTTLSDLKTMGLACRDFGLTDAVLPFYVYALVDGDEVFYIGKGKGERYKAHEAEYRAGRIVNLSKFMRIRRIVTAGRPVLAYCLAQSLGEKTAYELEKYLIKTLPDLTNKAMHTRVGVRHNCNTIEDAQMHQTPQYPLPLLQRHAGLESRGINALTNRALRMARPSAAKSVRKQPLILQSPSYG